MFKLILGIIAVGLITFSSCKTLKDTGSSSIADSNSPYVKEAHAEKVYPAKKDNSSSNNNKSIVMKEEQVKIIDNDNSESYHYYAIIGSFKVLQNAHNYKATLIKQGFVPVILKNTAGLYRVSVFATNSESQARTKISNIRSQYSKYSDAWLLVSKQ